jgi:hypothetical protein
LVSASFSAALCTDNVSVHSGITPYQIKQHHRDPFGK